jgi:hypothetical protein
VNKIKNQFKFEGKSKKDLNQYVRQVINKYDKRFKFWQNKRIDLLNWSIGIITSLTVAFIVYWSNLYRDKMFNCLTLLSIPLFNYALILLISTLLMAVIILRIRIEDFRQTIKIIKLKKLKFKVQSGIEYYSEKSINIDTLEDTINLTRKKSHALGNAIHCLYKIQLI